MQAGNTYYRSGVDLPDVVAVFPLKGALLLPSGQLPLNIFEPRYLEMIDDAMATDRIIGLIQPRFDIIEKAESDIQEYDNSQGDRPELCQVGCLGRITTYAETGDGRLLITLQGICRFRIKDELQNRRPYRQCRISAFLTDLNEASDADDVDRESLLKTFRAYLEANDMDADWDSIARAGNETLVNALSIMSPFGAAEKQALLEAPDLTTRAQTLIAITELTLARDNKEFGSRLQ